MKKMVLTAETFHYRLSWYGNAQVSCYDRKPAAYGECVSPINDMKGLADL